MSTITVEKIREIRDFAIKNAIKPKVADNGIEYYEVRYRDKGQETLLHTPLSGLMIDLITGDKLIFP